MWSGSGTGGDIRIETPEMDEADLLADLWVQLARDQRAYESHLRPAANRASIREAVARHVVTGGVLVARDGEVVGFVMYGLETGEFEQGVTRGVVRNLFVRPERQNEGIGSRLLAAAERELADAGADVVSLEAMAANEDAIRFYERHGFRLHRVEFEKRIDGDPDDEAESDTHSKGERE